MTKVSKERREGFTPFLIPNGLGNRLDYAKLLNLSDEEFAERHLGDSTRRFYEHGVQALSSERSYRKMKIDEGLRMLECSDCREPLESPRDFVRYTGNSLHKGCFVKRWAKERKDEVRMGNPMAVKYFDRIARLIGESK